jgi:hypothetical protein
VIPHHPLGPDPRTLEAHDGDGQHLGPPEGTACIAEEFREADQRPADPDISAFRT